MCFEFKRVFLVCFGAVVIINWWSVLDQILVSQRPKNFRLYLFPAVVSCGVHSQNLSLEASTKKRTISETAFASQLSVWNFWANRNQVTATSHWTLHVCQKENNTNLSRMPKNNGVQPVWGVKNESQKQRCFATLRQTAPLCTKGTVEDVWICGSPFLVKKDKTSITLGQFNCCFTLLHVSANDEFHPPA